MFSFIETFLVFLNKSRWYYCKKKFLCSDNTLVM